MFAKTSSMKFKEWLNKVIETGNLCSSYKDKALDAKSKKTLIDLCLDSNGASYLMEMESKGISLSYETILSEFKSYLNGRYIAEYKNGKGNGYSSSIYCCFTDDNVINIETTLTIILGCKSAIMVKENDFVRIYADKNCELTIMCPKSSRCIVEYWDGAKIEVNENYDKVELIENK